MSADQQTASRLPAETLRRLRQIAGSSAEILEILPDIEDLLSRLETLQRDFAGQLQREKLASMQALAYGASHEINNPLANIAARAQSLLVDEQDPQRRRSLATINAQAFRAHEMIADLMLFAKPPAPHKKSVNLIALVEQVVRELADDARHQDTELRHASSGPAELLVEADEVQVGVALRALCQNALEAVRRGGRVLVTCDQAGDATQIHVSDTGPGLTDEARRHLFDPFYSGREAGRGLGMGLAKAWRIMEMHGGQILADCRAGQGTTMTLVFPSAAAAGKSN
ncbi:MAG TPA: HAMP domain-containing sensor histidine kinase [Pirellulaceae bacterium]|nr:HAMP domain-containing sensor histidine kinase [Pirellulaceae bacterium]